MLQLLFVIFLGYRNAQLAQQKGKNTVLWVIATVLAFFIATFIGMLFLLLFFYKGPLDLVDQKAVQTAMLDFFSNPVRGLFIDFAGVGGYLLVHYLLERMPDKQNPKNIWERDNTEDEEV